MSPASKKRCHEELEADIAALSSHSSDADVLSNPDRKTPEEIAAWCAEYERCQRREMAKRRMGIAGMSNLCEM